MKAMCPECAGKTDFDCPKCNNTKEIEVRFAEGEVFTTVCLNRKECGFVNGGRITKGGFPEESSGPCVICDGVTEWQLMKEVVEDENPGWQRNREKWHIHSLNKTVEKLRATNNELRVFARRFLPETITVEEARLLGVCRVCRKEKDATGWTPNVYNYGDEYSHSSCLEGKEENMM
jgi:hypothetical protein